MFPQDKVKAISASLEHFHITNRFLKAGILAVVSTETGFNIRSELSYHSTPPVRLRLIFGRRVAKYTDDELNKLRTDDVKFYDIIYGGQNGNLAVGDGWKYRGRGFNQITFKNSYSKYGTMIGVDLVSAPDRLNEPQIAADALAAYFSDGFKLGRNVLHDKYGVDDISLINDLPTASKVAHQCNAGWYTNLSSPALAEIHKKQLQSIDELYAMI